MSTYLIHLLIFLAVISIAMFVGILFSRWFCKLQFVESKSIKLQFLIALFIAIIGSVVARWAIERMSGILRSWTADIVGLSADHQLSDWIWTGNILIFSLCALFGLFLVGWGFSWLFKVDRQHKRQIPL